MADKLKACFSSKSVHWRTPKELYNELNKEFKFDFDPCPFEERKIDGLNISWKKRVYCNPPYNQIYAWLLKGLMELRLKHTEIIVYLLPSRTDTDWFHELVLKNYSEIRLIRGRIKFNNKSNAPFPSCIIIFERKKR